MTIFTNVYKSVLDINGCLPNPCEHGATCIDRVNDFQCICPPGFSDKNCCTGNYHTDELLLTKYRVSYPHSNTFVVDGVIPETHCLTFLLQLTNCI